MTPEELAHRVAERLPHHDRQIRRDETTVREAVERNEDVE